MTDATGVVDNLVDVVIPPLSTALNALPVADAESNLLALTNKTGEKVTAVNNQIARVEKLLTAVRNQELEEATWEERKQASEAKATELV